MPRRAVALAVGALLAFATPASASESGAPPVVTKPTGDYRVASSLGLAGTYAALSTWMWVAWYKDQPKLPHWKFGGDGWFGQSTYAGGADKLGHVWATLALSRLGTEVLRSGGWGRLPSSLPRET